MNFQRRKGRSVLPAPAQKRSKRDVNSPKNPSSNTRGSSFLFEVFHYEQESGGGRGHGGSSRQNLKKGGGDVY